MEYRRAYYCIFYPKYVLVPNSAVVMSCKIGTNNILGMLGGLVWSGGSIFLLRALAFWPLALQAI